MLKFEENFLDIIILHFRCSWDLIDSILNHNQQHELIIHNYTRGHNTSRDILFFNISTQTWVLKVAYCLPYLLRVH